MDATQQIDDSFCVEEDETDDTDDRKEQGQNERKPRAALKVFKNSYIPETEVPLYLGENVLGRDPASCSTPLLGRSISSRHAIISVSVYRRQGEEDAVEALLWDLGSLNGTRKGRVKLTPHVRYALTEGDSVVLADLPCQYIGLKAVEKTTDAASGAEETKGLVPASNASEKGSGKNVENGGRRSAFPPVPIWGDKEKTLQSPQTTPRQPERTLVPESDSDSEGERDGRRPRQRRFLASNSTASDLSSPTCSTFLTPSNVIPESEDESSITPSSALMGRLINKEILSEVSSGSPTAAPLNFSVDSDTDVEEESVSRDGQVDQVDPACLHMDSDTDVEDEETTKAKSLEISAVSVQKDCRGAPAGCTMDSDTDVDENEPFGPSSRTKAVLETKTSTEFRVDSDTDVEDEEVPVTTKLETPVSGPPAVSPAKAVRLISDSETDDEDPFKPKAVEKLKAPQAMSEQPNSNSDTDLEDDVTATNVCRRSPPQVQPPGEKEFRMDSDTDVEDEEKLEERDQKGSAEAAGIIQSSTPRGAGLSEEMETQPFLSPSRPFKRPALPSLLQPAISPGGRGQDSDDFTVAETQSFVADAPAADATLDETQKSPRGCGASTFQLGLSDSSHQQPDAEDPQAEDPAEEDWTLQSTQLYAKTSGGREASAEAAQKLLDLEATQAYAAAGDQEEEEEEEKEEEEEEETQPLVEGSKTSNTTRLLITGEGKGMAVDSHGEMVDSHPSTADTLILVRSPMLEEPTLPYTVFTAQTLPLDVEEEEEEVGEPTSCQRPLEPDAVAVAETLPMGEDEEEHKEEPLNDATSRWRPHEARKTFKVEETQPLEPDASSGVAIAETQPMGEDEEEREEEQQNESTPSLRALTEIKTSKVEETQPLEPDASSGVAIAETQPMDEDEEEHEEATPSLRALMEINTSKVEETQPLEPDASTGAAIAETQPIGEDEEEHEEATPSLSALMEINTSKVEETQPLEPDASTGAAIAETQPIGEDEEEHEEEEEEEPQIEAVSSRRSRRGRKIAKLEEKSLMGEAEKAQEEDGQNEATTSRRPPKGRRTAKAELDADSSAAIAGTEPLDAKEEAQEEEPKRPRRGTRTPKTEPAQPLEPHASTPVDTTETQPVDEDEERPEEEPSSEPRRPRRGRKSAKAGLLKPGDESEPEGEEERGREEKSLRGKGRGATGRARGRAAAEEGKRKRGKAVTEEEEESEEEADRGRKGRGRKSTRCKPKEKGTLDPEEEKEDSREEREQKGDEERERKEKEENERIERDEKEKLEKERLEKEKLEKERLEKEKLEKERLEKEKLEKERLEKEKLEKEKEDKERLEKEKLEKERLEKEKLEKERLEKEKLEKERLEKEKLEKEKEDKERFEKEKLEKERLEKEKLEKERLEKEKLEKERLEKEKLEKERLEKEKLEKERLEKERLEKEKLEKEKEEKERLEKESQEKEELEQKEEEERREQDAKEEKTKKGKEKGRVQGKRRAGLLKNKGEQKEDVELEDGNEQRENGERTTLEKEEETGETAKLGREDGKNKKQAEGEAKPGRGRRTTRKSTAPPASLDESASDDVPAKRTRSRSNSSNSVSSERPASIVEDQTRGRGRGRPKKSAEEQVDGGRPSSRRKTATAPSSKTEETKRGLGACTRSRSTSRSSERSSITAETPNQGSGRKGRKSVKVEKPEKEESHVPAASGRGRGRGAKRPGVGHVKAEAAGEARQEKETGAVSVGEDSFVSQTPSRGRKRGADTSVLAAEAPQLTPKTPRRSLTGQTHKVLFTGLVDEDGEKVLVRLGGGLAKGVGDMTHLVTDKVRRTVKFLCAVARGVPIVTTDWLTKCGKAGTFLSPNEFLVKDVEQERKFNFKLQEALRIASRQPLLQGYEIHVTPSVKPEPCQMKDIITCCGARYLPKMPSAHKPQVVVVSCEEDRALCNKASSLSVPVVSAEFLLTGILQQKVDLQTFALSASTAAASKPAPQSRRR
ncbi:mediator of DNA damage checkpoint protein 1 isoform X2 [Salminus brasiliensis]